ncbi:MAG: heme NO-binding domain-containing protein [Acidisphaera sp.]|nr:heme NO-binding domain-containing protein [Acidisphaera sp.]
MGQMLAPGTIGRAPVDRCVAGVSMKGVVFNLLEEVVIRHQDEDVWDELLERAGVAGAYTSLGSYSDEDMHKLLAAAAGLLGRPPREVLRWFGQQAMSVLAERYPSFFARCPSSRPFVLSVNSIIHPEVRKLYTGAHCPNFQFQDTDDGALMMDYRSPRKLCALAQGFVEGAAAHYGERVTFEHLECMHDGDARCLFRITWP